MLVMTLCSGASTVVWAGERASFTLHLASRTAAEERTAKLPAEADVILYLVCPTRQDSCYSAVLPSHEAVLGGPAPPRS